ncbi:unnamed protein product, partial [Scytosiphon promiscuus]
PRSLVPLFFTPVIQLLASLFCRDFFRSRFADVSSAAQSSTQNTAFFLRHRPKECEAAWRCCTSFPEGRISQSFSSPAVNIRRRAIRTQRPPTTPSSRASE